MTNKLKIYEDILAFHNAAEVPSRDTPGFPDDDRVALRRSLIEEEVGETVQVADGEGAGRLGSGQGDEAALGAATDGSGPVESGGTSATAGEDEVGQRLQSAGPLVDPTLEKIHVALLDRRDVESLLVLFGDAEVGAEVE